MVLVAELGIARLALQHATAEAARAGALTNDDEQIRGTLAATVAPLAPRPRDERDRAGAGRAAAQRRPTRLAAHRARELRAARAARFRRASAVRRDAPARRVASSGRREGRARSGARDRGDPHRHRRGRDRRPASGAGPRARERARRRSAGEAAVEAAAAASRTSTSRRSTRFALTPSTFRGREWTSPACSPIPRRSRPRAPRRPRRPRAMAACSTARSTRAASARRSRSSCSIPGSLHRAALPVDACSPR